MPTFLPPPRTGSCTCLVGKPAEDVGHCRGLSRTVPSGSMRAPFSVRRIPDETAILEGQEVAEFRRHGHQDEIRFLAPGDPFGHVVDAAQFVAPFGGGAPMPLAACRQFAHEKADDDEEDLRGEVTIATDPERLVGDGQEEVERERREQARTERRRLWLPRDAMATVTRTSTSASSAESRWPRLGIEQCRRARRPRIGTSQVTDRVAIHCVPTWWSPDGPCHGSPSSLALCRDGEELVKRD